MNFQWSFNALEHNPAGTFTIIPVGDYPVVISSAEVKATSAGDGGMLVLERTITSGPLAGTKAIQRLNLWNNSEKAKEIANRELAAVGLVCNVVHFASPADLQKLKGIPHQMVIGLQKYKEGSTKLAEGQTPEQWEAIGYTEVVGVKDASGNPPKKGQPYTGQVQQGGQPQQQQQTQPTAGNGGWGAGPQQTQQVQQTEQPNNWGQAQAQQTQPQGQAQGWGDPTQQQQGGQPQQMPWGQ